MKTHLFLIANLLLASAAAHAADGQPISSRPDTAMDSAGAFARLKTLAGEWRADTGVSKAKVTYESIAGGTSVVEREELGKMPVMITVYHMDGDRLMLEHYCAAGNQPRMEARSFSPETGELRFRFLDATNLRGKDAAHMHNATFHLVDNDHFTAAWELYEGGRSKSVENFEYTRVK